MKLFDGALYHMFPNQGALSSKYLNFLDDKTGYFLSINLSFGVHFMALRFCLKNLEPKT